MTNLYDPNKVLLDVVADRVTSISLENSSSNLIHNSKMLSEALEKNDAEMVEFLLEQPDIDVNYVSDSFERSPLQLASSIEIAHKLIKRGANINARSKFGVTPLEFALTASEVAWDNLEMVCMLLYYGADVNVLSVYKMTPLMQALSSKNWEISSVLLNYYDDFSCTSFRGLRALDYAIRNKSPLAKDLIKAGASVNYVNDDGYFPLLLALENEDTDLFKEIWARLDHQILLNSRNSFLLSYFVGCVYEKPKWLEYLAVILESPVAVQLTDKFDGFNSCYGRNTNNFFFHLLMAFEERKIKLNDRMIIINLCLRLGLKVEVNAVNFAYRLYKFNEELEAFIYAGNLNYHYRLDLLPTYIYALEDLNPAKFLEFQKLLRRNYDLFETGTPFIGLMEIKHSIGFFALPSHFKQYLISSDKELLEKLEEMPEFPSLVELSRNEVRKFIKQNYKIKFPYEFHDIVKSLSVPKYIQDIIRFKVPIYRKRL